VNFMVIEWGLFIGFFMGSISCYLSLDSWETDGDLILIDVG
jgi:hypothetical protein